MNTYEKRMARRKALLLERAQQARSESAALTTQERELGQYVPAGQPILVDHYSKHRHRRVLDRLNSMTRKAIDKDRLAEKLEMKAKVVGTGGVAFDDPDAIGKLEEKLNNLISYQEMIKVFNKRVRKLHTEAERKALAEEVLTEDFYKWLEVTHHGYWELPSYHLTNNGATIRRTRARIEELRAAEDDEDVEMEGDGFTYTEDSGEGRAIFTFDGKPEEEARTHLRRCGWKWAPSQGVWTRLLTHKARHDGRAISKRWGAVEVQATAERAIGGSQLYVCLECGASDSFTPIKALQDGSVVIEEPCCSECQSSNVDVGVD